MLNLLAASEPHKPAWYAIKTKSRYEKVVASSVRARGYEVLLPLYSDARRWGGRDCEVQLPLFSGYVFAHFNRQRRLPILQTPGVVQIVGTREGPWPIAIDEIQNIGRIVELGVHATPWPYLSVGEVVEIVRGPLAGVQGKFIRQKNGNRLVLSVSLLQRAMALEVDLDALRPVSSRVPHAEIIISSYAN